MQTRYPDPGRPDYCARCATRLGLKPLGGVERPHCSVCGWTYYAKPALGAAVLLVQAGQLLLVQRAHDPFKGQWMLPAGFVEYGETAWETAVREAAEETGLSVQLGPLFGLYFGADDPRNVAHLVVFHAHATAGSLRPGDDAAAVRFFGPDDLPERIAFRAHREALADWSGTTRQS